MQYLKLLIYSSLFILYSSLSFGQSWDWGAAGYASLKANDYGSPVATDKTGNAYITGDFATKVIFGSYTLIGNDGNAYLVKYDANGNVLWVIQAKDSTGYSVAASVSVDKLGNVYICGMCEGIVKFGPNILNANKAESSVFLVKFSSSGNVIWAKQSVAPNSTCYSTGYSVTTDNSDNVFITGYFRDTISFGTDTLIPGYLSTISVFLTKYDSLGNVIWAKQPNLPSSSCNGYGNSVASDNIGNVYLTGYFETAIFFGSYQLISLNNYSAFLAKYSSTGNLLWAKQSFNITINSALGYAYSTITDRGNNCYLTGYFEDSVQFGSTILSSPSEYSVFLTKYDSNGNVLWANQSSQGWKGTSLSSDTLNRIYLGGENSISDSTLTFGDLTLNAVPWASSNSFLVRFDANGEPACGSILENIGNSYYPIGITSDPSGNHVYMAGTFEDDTVKCGIDTLISNTGGSNTFVGRWLNCAKDAGINSITSPNLSVTLFPNPNNGIFTVELSHPELVSGYQTIEIYNVLGEQIYSGMLKPVQHDYEINLSSQSNGIYLYRVVSESGTLIGEGKVVIEK
jgi:hypothetical protein